MSAIEVDDGVRRLARRLAALPEGKMRISCLVEFITKTGPAHAVAILEHLRRQGHQGTPPYHIALLTLVQAISERSLDYQQITELYQAATDQGLSHLAVMFLSNAVDEMSNPTGLEKSRRESTLGHRKSMARDTDRLVFQKLLRDPEAPVVRILLNNPRLTEDDVVRLAARRPTDPSIQQIVAQSTRWIARYRVKRALILNPATPPDISIRLLPFINLSDLDAIGRDPALPDLVRSTAASQADDRRSDGMPPVEKPEESL